VIDIVNEVEVSHRKVGSGRVPAGQGHAVVLTRSYDAAVEDVWDAITNPERISRWFLPVSGDLRLGGRYQLEGNAGGEILRCEPPRLLKVSWVFGDGPADGSEVEVRLSASGEDETVLELEHVAVVDPERWAEYGPGGVGVGWDLTFLGLGLHLRGVSIGDPNAWMATPEARQLMTDSSAAWGAANEAAGATSEQAGAAVENTTKFYAPEP
jgi:uncharacterized protein YndB with AHSA1/START domain